MVQAPVLYIHGLNTFGDDYLHFGPWRGQLMHHYLREAFQKDGIAFHPVLDLSSKSLAQQVKVARQCLLEIRQQHHGPFHLLGHSMGGLVARRLAESESDAFLSLTTLATPHQGTPLAEAIVRLHQNRLKATVLGWLGYAVENRLPSFVDLEPEQVKGFFTNDRALTLPSLSVTFACPFSDLPFSFKILQKWAGVSFEGDGFVPLASQIWQRTDGPYQLDHLAEIGFFRHLFGQRRRVAQQEFARYTQHLIQFWQTVEDQGKRR